MHSKGVYLDEVLLTMLVVVAIELTIFVIQIITFLWRPEEKKRIWQIILLFLIILRTIVECLFDTPRKLIVVPAPIQTFLGQLFEYVIVGYFPIYWYKTLGFKSLIPHARYGPVLIIIPCIVTYLIFSGTPENIRYIKLYSYIIPFFYLIFLLGTVLWDIYRLKKINSIKTRLTINLIIIGAPVPYILMLIMNIFFHQPNWIVEAIMNVGFIIGNTLFIRMIVTKSKNEHIEFRELTKSLTAKVREQTLQLERKNQEIFNTYINIIHETKTPLTLIKNYMDDYIQHHKKSLELDAISQNINKLTQNVSNLFDTERFIRGVSVYNHENVTNFSQVLRDNMSLFRNQFQNNAELSESIEENILVQADPNAINSIINNLVENALKFSNHVRKIHAKLCQEGNNVIFSVCDNGIGIPIKMQKKIFEPYFQINTQKKNSQGMGLGLPILKKIVEELNGQIDIDSNPEIKIGTTIKVTLGKANLYDSKANVVTHVVPKNNTLTLSEIHITSQIYNPQIPSVLVVEDTKAMVEYLTKKLSKKYNVDYALNGSDALKKLHEVSPDLIIADIMMDVMDGFKFIKVMYEIDKFKHIPLIFLSAKITKEDRLMALKLGAIDLIQKPFSFTELAYKIESILKNIANQKQATHNNIIQSINGLGKQEDLQLEKIVLERRNKNYKLYNLTPKEIEIVDLVRDGLTYPEVAKAICRSEHTVKNHMSNVFAKCEVHNQIELFKKLDS